MNNTNLIHIFITAIMLCITSCDAGADIVHKELEGKWAIEFQHDDIGVANTIMNFSTDGASYCAYTRKKADKDILGTWKALLARTFTDDFKNGSLLRIEQGIIKSSNDTLLIAGVLTSAMGNYAIKGYVFNNKLFANIISNGKKSYKGKLTGTREIPPTPLGNYSALFSESIKLTEEKIYNRKVLQTREWKQFVKSMQKIMPKIQDDLEMVFAFFYFAGKLPYSHYALMKLPETTTGDTYKENSNTFFEEKEKRIAYLRIYSFGGSSKEIDSVFSIINQRQYEHLIVDLRNNSGGSVEAGMTFVRNIVDTSFYGGVFLTQKYFNNNNHIPTPQEYKQFENFTAANFDLILEGIHSKKGLCLQVIPTKTAGDYKIFVLTNNRTASTCEPIVYGLKQYRLATIVGEKTAGAMLNGEIFKLEHGYNMIIPTADYYTADGFHIDRNGVEPNVNVNSEDALEYVLVELIGVKQL